MNETTQPAVAGPVEPTVRRHTPGPWRFELAPNGGFDIEKDPNDLGRYMVIATRNPHPERAAEMHANARLIAAAPDMLNALRSLLRHAERMQDVMDEECGIRFRDDGPMSMARDALRLAVGAA